MTLSKKIKERLNKLGQELTNNNKKKTLEEIKNILDNKKNSIRTLSVNYSLAKRLMKEYTKDKEFLKQIKPNDSITKTILKQNENKLNESKMTVITKEFIEKILSFNGSNDLFKLALYLLLTSGRRVSELVDSKFTGKNGSKKITISNIRKRSDKNQNLEIPLLVSKTTFIKNLRKFKQRYKYSNHKTFQRTLLRHTKKLLGENIHPHVLRKIYANYLFKFRNPSNLTINPFIKDVLQQQSLSSSFFYTNVKLDFDKDFMKRRSK